MLTLYIENHLQPPLSFPWVTCCLLACGVVVCSSLPGMRDGILFHASVFDVTGTKFSCRRRRVCLFVMFPMTCMAPLHVANGLGPGPPRQQ